mmetsp:Transcript_16876/g.50589  ORF Transcript_16876/g.50589 Transcript_16876/m.50589 type:complete len:285 (+) Transcript_16876:126-980(+)
MLIPTYSYCLLPVARFYFFFLPSLASFFFFFFFLFSSGVAIAAEPRATASPSPTTRVSSSGSCSAAAVLPPLALAAAMLRRLASTPCSVVVSPASAGSCSSSTSIPDASTPSGGGVDRFDSSALFMRLDAASSSCWPSSAGCVTRDTKLLPPLVALGDAAPLLALGVVEPLASSLDDSGTRCVRDDDAAHTPPSSQALPPSPASSSSPGTMTAASLRDTWRGVCGLPAPERSAPSMRAHALPVPAADGRAVGVPGRLGLARLASDAGTKRRVRMASSIACVAPR